MKKGSHHTEETRIKISERKKEMFRTGELIHSMLGKHQTDETKRKISKSKIGVISGDKHPMWGKHHSEETKQKIREANMGKYPSEETRRKNSEANSGKNNPMYGKHHSAESNLMNRLAHLGKHHTEETKRKMKGRTPWSKGKKLPPLSVGHKRKLSEALSGENNPMFGKKHSMKTRKLMRKNTARYNLGRKFSKETRKKMSENHADVSGENNPFWHGDVVGYNSLHDWVKRRKKKSDVCEMCKCFEPIHLSNISGEYKRDVDDYQWLCRDCHRSYDEQMRDAIGSVSKERRKKYRE